MRTALLTALLLIIPHVMHGAPEDNLQVNGGASSASDIVRQNEQQLELERQEALRQPTSNTPNPPPVIPCPAAQQSRDAQLDDLARLETHSTTCPEGGTIKDMPTQPPEGTSPSGDQPVDIQ